MIIPKYKECISTRFTYALIVPIEILTNNYLFTLTNSVNKCNVLTFENV